MQASPTLKKTRQGALVALVVLVAATIVGVAVALVVIPVTANVSSNEFVPSTTTTVAPTTTTTQPPAQEGIVAALSPFGGPNNCGTFSADAIDIGDVSFDLNTGTGTTGQFLCIKNTNTLLQVVDLAVATTASGETACSSNESAVDPDGTDCGTNGELAALIQFDLTLVNGSSSCLPSLSVAAGASTSMIFPSGMSNGDVCSYEVDLSFVGTPTDDQKSAASTDSAGFTLSVSGSFQA
jgi:hypothetical protein